MILQKEFYFVRHGQTDHNLLDGLHKGDHAFDIPLNETGRNQAKSIHSTISALPVKTVCSSPLMRAQETKNLITSALQVNHHDINDLGECSTQTWIEMVLCGMYSPPPNEGIVRRFMNRVRNGINQALTLPGPPLIVAHGGVHWALCCLIGVEEHEWAIDNCIPVHFSPGNAGKWIAKKLI